MDRMMTTQEKLVWDANNVGKFFAPQGHDKAVLGIRDHLRKSLPYEFRVNLLAEARRAPEGFAPLVLEAIGPRQWFPPILETFKISSIAT